MFVQSIFVNFVKLIKHGRSIVWSLYKPICYTLYVKAGLLSCYIIVLYIFLVTPLSFIFYQSSYK